MASWTDTNRKKFFPWPRFGSHDTDSIHTDDLKYIWLKLHTHTSQSLCILSRTLVTFSTFRLKPVYIMIKDSSQEKGNHPQYHGV